MAEFSSIVSGNIDTGAVTASANAGKAIAEMADTIPNSGGVSGWFTGENDLIDFAKQGIWEIKPKRLYQFELIYQLVRQHNPEHITLTRADKDLINQLHDCNNINYQDYLAERCKSLKAVLS